MTIETSARSKLRDDILETNLINKVITYYMISYR